MENWELGFEVTYKVWSKALDLGQYYFYGGGIDEGQTHNSKMYPLQQPAGMTPVMLLQIPLFTQTY